MLCIMSVCHTALILVSCYMLALIQTKNRWINYIGLCNGIVFIPMRQSLTNQTILPLQTEALESKLSDAQVTLNQALNDKERLLLEIRKYDPAFTL